MTDARTRYTVTLRPDFEAKPNNNSMTYYPQYLFQTANCEAVHAFDRDPLIAARWREPGHLDSRQSWRKIGPYTFGREVEAVVEVMSRGGLKLVTLLTRGDEKVRVAE
jgi:hypothetical protein